MQITPEILWDTKNPRYYNEILKKSAWEEVAKVPKLILQSDKLKTSTLRSIYPTSMLKTKLNIRKNIDINQYSRLRAFLRKSIGYTPKKINK
jgi:hypothetical protein